MENNSREESRNTEILNQLQTIAKKSKRYDIQRKINSIQNLTHGNKTKPLLKLLEKLVTTKERNKKYLSLPNARKRHRENQEYVENLLQSVDNSNRTEESAIDDLFHIYKAQKQHLFNQDRLHLRFNKHSVSLLMEVEKLKRAANNFHHQRHDHTLSIPSVTDRRSLNQQELASRNALLAKATGLLSNIHTADENELQARILMAKTLIKTLQITLPENCTEEHQQLINDAQSSTIATLLALSPSEIFQGNANENTRVFGVFDNNSSDLTRSLYKSLSSQCNDDSPLRIIKARDSPLEKPTSLSGLNPKKQDLYSAKFQVKIDQTGNPVVHLNCGAITKGQFVRCFPWYDSQQQKFTISKVTMKGFDVVQIKDEDWLGENLEIMTQNALSASCEALHPTAGEGLISMFEQIANQLQSARTPNRDLKLDNILFNPYTQSIHIIDNTDNPPPGTFNTGLSSDPALFQRIGDCLEHSEGLPKKSTDLTDILCPETTNSEADFNQKCTNSLRNTLQAKNPNDLQKILCGTLAASVALGSGSNRFHDYWALLNCGEAMAYRYGEHNPSAQQLRDVCISEKAAMLNALADIDPSNINIPMALQVAKSANRFDRDIVEDPSFASSEGISVDDADFKERRKAWIQQQDAEKSLNDSQTSFTPTDISNFINQCETHSQSMETKFPVTNPVKIESLIKKLEPASDSEGHTDPDGYSSDSSDSGGRSDSGDSSLST